MILTETCGCGAAITIEDGPGEAHTVGVRRLIDEFRTLHAPCRSDSRAELTARATTWPESTTVIVNGTAAETDDIEDVDDAHTLDWDPYGDADVSDAHRLELVADYLERVNARRGVENRVPGDLRRLAADLRDRGPVGIYAADRTRRTTWPYTTPSGLTYGPVVTLDELARVHADAVQCSMENCREDEHPPCPTWDMVGLLWTELEALSRLVAETLAAGDTGSEYQALHDLIGVAEGRAAEVLPADVGVAARTLRRIGELRRFAVERIEAERDAKV